MRKVSAALYAFSGKIISDWCNKKYTNYSGTLTSGVPNALAGKRKVRMFKYEKILYNQVYSSERGLTSYFYSLATPMGDWLSEKCVARYANTTHNMRATSDKKNLVG